jgi:hypothetical protein
MCGLRRGFPVIKGVRLIRCGIMDHHKATATNVTGPGKRYRKGKTDANPGIDGVAAILENGQAGTCRLFLGDHHSLMGESRVKDLFRTLNSGHLAHCEGPGNNRHEEDTDAPDHGATMADRLANGKEETCTAVLHAKLVDRQMPITFSGRFFKKR